MFACGACTAPLLAEMALVYTPARAMSQEGLSSGEGLVYAVRIGNMKLRDNLRPGPSGVSNISQEILRTKAIITSVRLSKETAHELRHTARNLRIV